MGALSIWHILILAIIAVLMFGGRGKISDLMSDVGKGVKSFRQGLKESESGETNSPPPVKQISAPSDPQSSAHSASAKDQSGVER
jgi:sec-independent protein translocase protein TatA